MCLRVPCAGAAVPANAALPPAGADHPSLARPQNRAKWLGPFSDGAVPSYLKGTSRGLWLLVQPRGGTQPLCAMHPACRSTLPAGASPPPASTLQPSPARTVLPAMTPPPLQASTLATMAGTLRACRPTRRPLPATARLS